MIVLSSVGLFGSGIPLGSESCETQEVFGPCHDLVKTNAANIQKLADFTRAPIEDVFKLRSEDNENIFMVNVELAMIESVQQDLIEVQNRNWQLFEDLSELFRENIHEIGIVLRETFYEIGISYFSQTTNKLHS